MFEDDIFLIKKTKFNFFLKKKVLKDLEDQSDKELSISLFIVIMKMSMPFSIC
jgi:hypothetical protein